MSKFEDLRRLREGKVSGSSSKRSAKAEGVVSPGSQRAVVEVHEQVGKNEGLRQLEVGVASDTTPVFDRQAYQRDYMRRYRARKRAEREQK